MRLRGNEAAQDARLVRLEAKHSTHPHITYNVTDGRGLSGGKIILLGPHDYTASWTLVVLMACDTDN